MSRKLTDFFTAKDFGVVLHAETGYGDGKRKQIAEQIAKVANARLREWVKENGRRVWGARDRMLPTEPPVDWHTDKCMAGTDTHTGILLDVRPVGEG